jgi:hypothetical protein
MIPVSESLDRGKRVIARAKDSARVNLLEKDGFFGDFVIGQVIRQYDLRYINALCFLLIQPF